MAMKLFKAGALPNPPPEYSSQYLRELLRAIEIYFSQLDSNTPNYAESYTAKAFYGMPVAANVTTAQKLALPMLPGSVVFDTDLKKLCLNTGLGWETITSA